MASMPNAWSLCQCIDLDSWLINAHVDSLLPVHPEHQGVQGVRTNGQHIVQVLGTLGRVHPWQVDDWDEVALSHPIKNPRTAAGAKGEATLDEVVPPKADHLYL